MARQSLSDNKTQSFYEVICNGGLERFVQRELRRNFAKNHQLFGKRVAGEVLFSLEGEWKMLRNLATAEDIFRVLPFDVNRPRGILEPLKLREITRWVETLAKVQKDKPFKTFRLSAAGADSKDLTRIRQTIATATKLKEDPEDGDLLMRLRKSKVIENGWDVMIRLTRRPLHVRAWRISDYRGALNAPIARVMVELLDLKESGCFLDPMCGSGTLLAEQLLYRKIRSCIGTELLPKVIAQARKNLANIHSGTPQSLITASVSTLPLVDASIDGIAVNPPWGEAIREKEDLAELYQQLLNESLRVLKVEGKLCVITQATGPLEAALAKTSASFELLEKISVLQPRGFHPTIFLFQKKK